MTTRFSNHERPARENDITHTKKLTMRSYADIPAEPKPVLISGDTARLPAPHYSYEIGIEKMDSPARLLQWASHLGRKNWATGLLLAELVHQVTRYHGWEVHGRS